MARNDVAVFIGLAGAMVPAGAGRLVAFLIEHNLIDCLVSTGANIFHDCYEVWGTDTTLALTKLMTADFLSIKSIGYTTYTLTNSISKTPIISSGTLR